MSHHNATFGLTMDIDADWAVIGSKVRVDTLSTGAAHFYHRDADTGLWTGTQVIPPSAGIRFGGTWETPPVSVCDDLAVVGGHAFDSDQATVSVYRRNGSSWDLRTDFEVEGTYLQPEDLQVSGDRIFVGARYTDAASNTTDAVHIYRHNGSTWELEARLLDPYSELGYYGWHLAADGNLLVVGALSHSGPWYASGGAFIYEHDGTSWQFRQEISLLEYVDLGASVAVSGDRIAFATERCVGTKDVVLIYDRSDGGWVPTAELFPQEPASSFYSTCDLDGDTLVFGANANNMGPGIRGSAYVFEYDGQTWFEAMELVPPVTDEWFGTTVAIDGVTVLTSDPFDDTVGYDAGTVWFHTIPEPATAMLLSLGGLIALGRHRQPACGT